MQVFGGHHDRLPRPENPSGECRQKPFALLLGESINGGYFSSSGKFSIGAIRHCLG
jgi:hypothetical protein